MKITKKEKTKVVAFRVKPSTWDKLKLKLKANNLRVSDFINSAVESYLEEK